MNNTSVLSVAKNRVVWLDVVAQFENLGELVKNTIFVA
jgi:hypothetical protein